ncbi:MAG: peptidoglycan-binding domain-containing protein [Candidatus Omnitrophica bacterium]|nr:peptidoglycan-binding domain-containing protein [Candidatus Omnitrophota bacterium]
MGRKSLVCLTVAILAAFIISGCGTSQKKVQTEVTGIKTRVETLESRVEGVESKQAEVERLAAEQAQALDELKTTGAQAKTNISVKTREGSRSEKMRDIQQALKNAGYYNGKIDGVKGKSTRKAIKEFQKANGLKADGVVGRKTWDMLSKHLSDASANTAPAAAPDSVSGDEGVK